jgi:hypothetical protein
MTGHQIKGPSTDKSIRMNEIRDWLSEHGYKVLSEIITVEGAWLLGVETEGVTIPVTLLSREVEHPQRGIAAIESLFTAIRTDQ